MKKTLFGAAILVAAVLYYWLFFDKQNPQEYINQLTIHRHEQVEYFRYAPESPFLTKKVDFSYIDYYPANLKLRIDAKFEKRAIQDTLSLATSTGSIDKFLIVGTAHFKWNNIDNTLLVLASTQPNDPTLFIPFLDKTSGETTYGGGRYLNVLPPNRNKIELDFNKAYNPYCTYVDGYTCALPPKENRLVVAIEAGEKSYQAHN